MPGEHHYASPPKAALRRSDVARHAKDRHKRAAKMLGYALTLDDLAGWNAASHVWAARLERGERAALAMAAFCSMDRDEAEALVKLVFGGAGAPSPSFLDPLDDAQWWADLASPAELRAYCLAAFMVMPRKAQHDFLDFAKGVTA